MIVYQCGVIFHAVVLVLEMIKGCIKVLSNKREFIQSAIRAIFKWLMRSTGSVVFLLPVITH